MEYEEDEFSMQSSSASSGHRELFYCVGSVGLLLNKKLFLYTEIGLASGSFVFCGSRQCEDLIMVRSRACSCLQIRLLFLIIHTINNNNIII
jgi:hypothetical protein